jgi:hypothetical protein
MSATICASLPPNIAEPQKDFQDQLSHSVSQGARQALKSVHEVFNALCGSWTLGEKNREILKLLDEISEECNTDDWDGYGAVPVSNDALAKARDFIAAFPPNLPAPEVSASASGEVLFDWIQNQDRMVTVAIDGDGKVSFASVNGGASSHGSYIFTGLFDPRIDARIREVLS